MSSTLICNRCLDGFHQCWPGDCACTVCDLPVAKRAPARKPKRVQPHQQSPTTLTGRPRKIAPHLSPEMSDYIARSLLDGSRTNCVISPEEWDAVHARPSWSHNEVARELELTFERVRYIRRMARPTDEGPHKSFVRLADRVGATPGQVHKVMRDLVTLRDASTWDAFTPPKARPPEPCTFA